MDEHNNNQHEEVRAVERGFIQHVEAKRGGFQFSQESAGNGAGKGSAGVVIAPGAVTRSAPADSTSPQTFAQRRSRINRILLIKRRHERSSRNENLAPRLMVSTFVLAALLFSLLS